MDLYDYLQVYAKSGKIPMHMPGTREIILFDGESLRMGCNGSGGIG